MFRDAKEPHWTALGMTKHTHIKIDVGVLAVLDFENHCSRPETPYTV